MDRELDLELARQIAVNSGDIQDTMISLIEEIERVRDNPPSDYATGTFPAIDLLFEAGAQFRMYQGQHEGKSMDTKKTEAEREQHRAKANINRSIADRIDALLLANGAPHGWVAYGPDGEWHWSMAKPDHPELEDERPATSLERGILGLIGGNTGMTREFNDWKKQTSPQYHELAMRTAAGPEVFHRNMFSEHPASIASTGSKARIFIVDSLVNQILASRVLSALKATLFYGKPFELPGSDEVYNLFHSFDVDQFDNYQLLHAILGICSEGGELLEDVVALVSLPDPSDCDEADLPKRAAEADKIGSNTVREIGDIGWFTELFVHARGFTVETARTTNIERLSKRFPDKFTESAAIARADEDIDHSGYVDTMDATVTRRSTPVDELNQYNGLGDTI